jgi:hypothetical protein
MPVQGKQRQMELRWRIGSPPALGPHVGEKKSSE